MGPALQDISKKVRHFSYVPDKWRKGPPENIIISLKTLKYLFCLVKYNIIFSPSINKYVMCKCCARKMVSPVSLVLVITVKCIFSHLTNIEYLHRKMYFSSDSIRLGFVPIFCYNMRHCVMFFTYDAFMLFCCDLHCIYCNGNIVNILTTILFLNVTILYLLYM